MQRRQRKGGKRTDRLSVLELAVLLEIPISQAYRGLRVGDIPSQRVGGRYLVYESLIRAWLKGKSKVAREAGVAKIAGAA